MKNVLCVCGTTFQASDDEFKLLLRKKKLRCKKCFSFDFSEVLEDVIKGTHYIQFENSDQFENFIIQISKKQIKGIRWAGFYYDGLFSVRFNKKERCVYFDNRYSRPYICRTDIHYANYRLKKGYVFVDDVLQNTTDFYIGNII